MKRGLIHRVRLSLIFSLAVFVTLLITGFILGAIAVAMFRSGLIDRMDRMGASRFPVPILVFLFASVVLGTLVSFLVGRLPLKPVRKIIAATNKLANGDFSTRLDIPRPPEFHDLAESFNRMAQELGSIEIFRNDFINNVSHEFKTPLSAIEGYATLLQNKSISEEKRDIYSSKILYNSKRLSSLTGNILQLSHLENQEITAEKRWFSLDEQIRENILMYEAEWGKKNLELDIDLEAVSYYGNADLLSQVWQNLIGNALKFVFSGGSIRVILRKEDSGVKIYVSDNGIGMSEQVKQRVFEKFYQGDTSHSSEGNGLGLTLAKRIVVLHSGKIEVSSKEGKGTTFTVILPNNHDI